MGRGRIALIKLHQFLQYDSTRLVKNKRNKVGCEIFETFEVLQEHVEVKLV
jgi:hypothetical protein